MGKKSPLQKLALINFGSSKMLGSVYPLWRLQAAALWLWGSDKDSTNSRDRVGSRKGTVPPPRRCGPGARVAEGTVPQQHAGPGAARKQFLQKIWTTPGTVVWEQPMFDPEQGSRRFCEHQKVLSSGLGQSHCWWSRGQG